MRQSDVNEPALRERAMRTDRQCVLGLEDDRGGLRARVVRNQRASAREVSPHGFALLFEIEIAMTVVGAFAIHVVVDHAEQRVLGERFNRNIDDLPSGHVTATATTVLARCISVPYRL